MRKAILERVPASGSIEWLVKRYLDLRRDDYFLVILTILTNFSLVYFLNFEF